MRVPFDDLKQEMKRVLLKLNFTEEKAETCARILAQNSADGVHSHGLNRFPVFVKNIRQGLIDVHAEPVVTSSGGCMEYWDGQLAPGIYVATLAMQRAIEIAKVSGMACVAVKNTNHWMRGGTYGWQAAEQGCIGICATNAIANMPPWGGASPTLGNNPLVIAVPAKSGHIVLDMAFSQFSYGKLQEYELSGKPLPVAGGYDTNGNLTRDPAMIRASRRSLPIGFWKGSGLALMVDLLVSVLSGGRTVADITKQASEHGVSQFFLCLSPANINEDIIQQVIAFTKTAVPADEHSAVRYPGERTLIERERSQRDGVLVNDVFWEEVKRL